MKDVKTDIHVTCNRCDREDVWDGNTPYYAKWEWSEVVLGQEDETHSPVMFDLCPTCTREVMAWIRNGR